MSAPPIGVVVNLKTDTMQTLGQNASETVYWDFSNTEDFYILTGGVLYRVSPKTVYTWFSNNKSTDPTVTITYNPFLGAFQNQMAQPSNLV